MKKKREKKGETLKKRKKKKKKKSCQSSVLGPWCVCDPLFDAFDGQSSVKNRDRWSGEIVKLNSKSITLMTVKPKK